MCSLWKRNSVYSSSPMRHGFLLIAKPKGPTSHDIVGMVRKQLNERNVGHLGTLDPAADGLMVVAVGAKALKIVELFNTLPKSYLAQVTFGAVSSTYDAEGVIERVPPLPGREPPDELQLRRILEERFIGRIQQVPPAFSAIKVDGIPAHKRARQGQDMQMQPRTVEIRRCEIAAYAYPELTLDVDCGSGTYIRSLAHDLGQMLRSGAYLRGLTRTKVGEWALDDAVAHDNVEWTSVIPMKDLLRSHPSVDVSDDEAAAIRNGKTIAREISGDTIAWNGGLPIAILIPAKDGSRGARPRKVF